MTFTILRHRLMCVATLGVTGAIEVGATAAATAASMTAEAEQSHANAKLIEGQETLQQNQIAQQAGNAESVAAKEARAARSQSIVAAGAAGISLGSNSFLASLQTISMNEAQQTQILNENERNSSSASTAQADTQLAQSASRPSIVGAALNTALAGGSAYAGADMMEHMGRGAPSDAGTFNTPASYYSDLSDSLIGSDM